MKNKYLKFFLILAMFAFALRLYLAQFLTYHLDLNTFKSWSYYLAAHEFKSFYANVWSDYLPGYHYILWFLGIIREWLIINSIPFNEVVFYKLPSIIADILNALFIFLIARKFAAPKKALFAAIFFLFNPAVLANSTFWGQADSFATLFIILSFYLILQKKFWFAAIIIGFGQTVKPIAFLSIPIYLIFIFLTNNKKLSQSLWKSLVFLIIITFTFTVTFLPFNHLPNLFEFINSLLQQTFHQYPYTSLNAFNFWAIASDFWIPDKLTFISVTFQNWGNILFGVIYALLLIILVSKFKAVENKFLFLTYILTICYFAMFMFLTRIHERHLFYGLTFISLLLPALSLKEILLSIIPFIIYILNLLFAYQQLIQKPLQWDKSTILLISIANLLALIYLAIIFLKRYAKFSKT